METVEYLLQELDKCPQMEGIAMLDVLGMPGALRAVMNKITRAHSINLSELAADLGLTLAQARQVGDKCVEKGLWTVCDQASGDQRVYQVRFARRKRGGPDVWKALDNSD